MAAHLPSILNDEVIILPNPHFRDITDTRHFVELAILAMHAGVSPIEVEIFHEQGMG